MMDSLLAIQMIRDINPLQHSLIVLMLSLTEKGEFSNDSNIIKYLTGR